MDWGDYDREFQRIALWLIEKRTMGEPERNRLYWKGVHKGAKKQILSRLQVVIPEHDLRDPYTYKEISDAALWVLAGKSQCVSDSSDLDFSESGHSDKERSRRR